MSDVLIAVSSCQSWEDRGHNQDIRDTWIKDIPPNVDFKFFHGRESTTDLPDVVNLPCPDDYLGLGLKTQEIYRWAFEKNYSFVFKCFSDTFVDVKRLLTSGYENYDYMGYIHDAPGTPHAPYGFCGGGEGFWLSRKAYTIITIAEADDPREDFWVGELMGKCGIHMTGHPEYGKSITRHGTLETGGKDNLDRSWMGQVHRGER